jgi:hypothetical protein
LHTKGIDTQLQGAQLWQPPQAVELTGCDCILTGIPAVKSQEATKQQSSVWCGYERLPNFPWISSDGYEQPRNSPLFFGQ